jgi:hypothetical protein
VFFWPLWSESVAVVLNFHAGMRRS